MKIAIIGTGYVGLPTGIGLAELGHKVTCIDKDEAKINLLNSGKMTLFEEGLEELFHKNLANKTIEFTTSMQSGVENADIVVIAVGTPPHPDTKEADMKYIYAAASELAKYLKGYTIVANKSTVPIGTGDKIEDLISIANPTADFDVVSLPEFLREGFAVHDFFNPDRIIIGTNNNKPKMTLLELYKNFDGKTEFLFVSRRSSEAIKYASNAFLAIKIHYINEMADFCEKVDANVLEVAKGMGLDTRIGARFLNPGPGYGGSCFPKDTLALAHMGQSHNVNLSLVEAAIAGNDQRKLMIAEKIFSSIKTIKNPKIAVLGLAFKSGTDDCRESPAIQIIQNLLNIDPTLHISAFDPQANETAKDILHDKISYEQSEIDALRGADVMVILTEWDQFRKMDLSELKTVMRSPKILDFRNLISSADAKHFGFEYWGIAKSSTTAISQAKEVSKFLVTDINLL